MEAMEIRQYEEFDVSFLLAGRNVKVNATQMAKIYGKRSNDFIDNEGVKAFIAEMELHLNSGNSDNKNYIKLVENRGAKGTWMHRVLALKFAAWLNVKFEVWVYMTIEEIMFGQLPELAQEKMKADEAVDDAEKILHESEMYKNYVLAVDYKKKVEKSIKAQQTAQLSLFTGAKI